MTAGKVHLYDHKTYFVYYVIYGRQKGCTGSGITVLWNYNKHRQVFEMPSLYWKNITEIIIYKENGEVEKYV